MVDGVKLLRVNIPVIFPLKGLAAQNTKRKNKETVRNLPLVTFTGQKLPISSQG